MMPTQSVAAKMHKYIAMCPDKELNREDCTKINVHKEVIIGCSGLLGSRVGDWVGQVVGSEVRALIPSDPIRPWDSLRTSDATTQQSAYLHHEFDWTWRW